MGRCCCGGAKMGKELIRLSALNNYPHDCKERFSQLSKGGCDGGLFFFDSRVAQRGGGLNSSAARSEHEVSEIIDGISEHEVSFSLPGAKLSGSQWTTL